MQHVQALPTSGHRCSVGLLFLLTPCTWINNRPFPYHLPPPGKSAFTGIDENVKSISAEREHHCRYNGNILTILLAKISPFSFRRTAEAIVKLVC